MSNDNLNSMTKAQLLELARKQNIPATGAILKKDLVALLRSRKPVSAKAKGRAAKPQAAASKPAESGGRKKKAPASRPGRGKKSAGSKPPRRSPGRPAKPLRGRRKSGHRREDSETPQAPIPAFTMEDMAQEAKFLIGDPHMGDEAQREETRELPRGYGVDRLVMMARDPQCVYCYWELRQETIENNLRALGRTVNEASLNLRLVPVSGAGETAPVVETAVHPGAGNWYLHLPEPGGSYRAEIGFRDESGRFVSLAVSNNVQLPPGRPSEIVDDRWAATGGQFEEIYALSGGYNFADAAGGQEGQAGGVAGGSGAPGLVSPALGGFSGAVSSFASAAFPEKRGFRFWVEAELILYGATEPGAKVTLAGERVELRADGTFTVRLALPDGRQNLPVSAESPDGRETRTIIPVVIRRTERPAPVIKED